LLCNSEERKKEEDEEEDEENGEVKNSSIAFTFSLLHPIGIPRPEKSSFFRLFYPLFTSFPLKRHTGTEKVPQGKKSKPCGNFDAPTSAPPWSTASPPPYTDSASPG